METQIIPNYKMTTDSAESGVFETSFVSDPATDKGFLKFNKHEDKRQQFKALATSEYQMMTAGVWMMPDTKYLRMASDGTLYTVEFTREALKNALLKYLKSGNADSVKLEHDGVYLESFVAIEHWIITSKTTKSPIFGLSLEDMGYNPDEIPMGTVMKTTYCNNYQFWYDYIVSGKVQGYSIGGLFDLIQTDTAASNFSKPEEISKRLKSDISDKIVNLTDNETLNIKNELFCVNETLAEGKKVFDLDGYRYQVEFSQGYALDFSKVKIEIEVCTGDSESETEKEAPEMDVAIGETSETPNIVNYSMTQQEETQRNNMTYVFSKNEVEERFAKQNQLITELLEKFNTFEQSFLHINKELSEKNKEIETLKQEFEKKPISVNNSIVPKNSNEGKTALRVGNTTIYI